MEVIYAALMVCVAAVLIACTSSTTLLEWAQHSHKQGGKPGPMTPADRVTPPTPQKPTRFDVMG